MELNETILNQMNDGIVICDPSGNIIFSNKVSEERLGSLLHGVTKVKGQNEDVLKYKEDAITLYEESELPMNQALAGIFKQNLVMLIVFQDHSSESIWLSINTLPIKDNDGKIVSGMITIRDLSERKKTEHRLTILNGKVSEKNKHLKVINEKLEVLTRELQLKNNELNSFATRVAHDLKTPLNPLIGFIDLLKIELKEFLNEDQKEVFNLISSSANSMNVLIFELLEFAKLEQSNDTLSTVKFSDLFLEIESLMTAASKEKGGIITIDENMPIINCKKIPAKQLFQNIISNSIKYHKENIPPEIIISCEAPSSGNDFYNIKIKDNGRGFIQEQAKHLFEPMYRLHNEKVEGHGLGLAISAKAAEKEGWKIKAIGVEVKELNFKFKFRALKP
ncbi:hypothetical protein A9Q84_13975 [Halobacteriovorax marinus]|uniref:histidine kinase n=1 Tax=Halobacteriovorax marinus TaxID=97084 RepID=A0A1Y5FEL3_9BACT|nr:hypothetical protein A9Q84_13975 [Halobacteriovorax marinus]